MNYNAKDVKVTFNQTVHKADCDYLKSDFTHWIEVDLVVFKEFVKDKYQYLHTIGNCVGYHEDDTPESSMLAKYVYPMYGDVARYFIYSEDGVGNNYPCSCEPETVIHELKGFSEDTFIEISKGDSDE